MQGLQSLPHRRNHPRPSEEDETLIPQGNGHQLALLEYDYTSTKPSALLNSIFMNTVEAAARTLVSVASTAKTDEAEKWKPADHMRFMLMMITWLAVWVLRVLMDHFPFSCSNSNYILDGIPNIGSFDFLSSSSSLSSSSPSPSLLGLLSPSDSPPSSLDLVLGHGCKVVSVKALGRALTNVLALLNEIPASSRKYQFAVAMADKIMEENARDGHVELLQMNRMALSSAFARTSGLVYCSLQSKLTSDDSAGSRVTRTVKSLRLGSYVSCFVKGLGIFFPSLASVTGRFDKQRQPAIAGEMKADDLTAEKHAEELLWMTKKMMGCGAVDEALLQWSLNSGLASLALSANSRVQGLIVKLTAMLIGEMEKIKMEVPSQVKYKVVALWLPLFCYAENGLSRPIMSSYEKG